MDSVECITLESDSEIEEEKFVVPEAQAVLIECTPVITESDATIKTEVTKEHGSPPGSSKNNNLPVQSPGSLDIVDLGYEEDVSSDENYGRFLFEEVPVDRPVETKTVKTQKNEAVKLKRKSTKLFGGRFLTPEEGYESDPLSVEKCKRRKYIAKPRNSPQKNASCTKIESHQQAAGPSFRRGRGRPRKTTTVRRHLTKSDESLKTEISLAYKQHIEENASSTKIESLQQAADSSFRRASGRPRKTTMVRRRLTKSDESLKTEISLVYKQYIEVYNYLKTDASADYEVLHPLYLRFKQAIQMSAPTIVPAIEALSASGKDPIEFFKKAYDLLIPHDIMTTILDHCKRSIRGEDDCLVSSSGGKPNESSDESTMDSPEKNSADLSMNDASLINSHSSPVITDVDLSMIDASAINNSTSPVNTDVNLSMNDASAINSHSSPGNTDVDLSKNDASAINSHSSPVNTDFDLPKNDASGINSHFPPANTVADKNDDTDNATLLAINCCAEIPETTNFYISEVYSLHSKSHSSEQTHQEKTVSTKDMKSSKHPRKNSKKCRPTSQNVSSVPSSKDFVEGSKDRDVSLPQSPQKRTVSTMDSNSSNSTRKKSKKQNSISVQSSKDTVEVSKAQNVLPPKTLQKVENIETVPSNPAKPTNPAPVSDSLSKSCRLRKKSQKRIAEIMPLVPFKTVSASDSLSDELVPTRQAGIVQRHRRTKTEKPAAQIVPLAPYETSAATMADCLSGSSIISPQGIKLFSDMYYSVVENTAEVTSSDIFLRDSPQSPSPEPQFSDPRRQNASSSTEAISSAFSNDTVQVTRRDILSRNSPQSPSLEPQFSDPQRENTASTTEAISSPSSIVPVKAATVDTPLQNQRLRKLLSDSSNGANKSKDPLSHVLISGLLDQLVEDALSDAPVSSQNCQGTGLNQAQLALPPIEQTNESTLVESGTPIQEEDSEVTVVYASNPPMTRTVDGSNPEVDPHSVGNSIATDFSKKVPKSVPHLLAINVANKTEAQIGAEVLALISAIKAQEKSPTIYFRHSAPAVDQDLPLESAIPIPRDSSMQPQTLVHSTKPPQDNDHVNPCARKNNFPVHLDHTKGNDPVIKSQQTISQGRAMQHQSASLQGEPNDHMQRPYSQHLMSYARPMSQHSAPGHMRQAEPNTAESNEHLRRLVHSVSNAGRMMPQQTGPVQLHPAEPNSNEAGEHMQRLNSQQFLNRSNGNQARTMPQQNSAAQHQAEADGRLNAQQLRPLQVHPRELNMAGAYVTNQGSNSQQLLNHSNVNQARTMLQQNQATQLHQVEADPRRRSLNAQQFPTRSSTSDLVQLPPLHLYPAELSAGANLSSQGSNSQPLLNRPSVNQARAMPLNQADAKDKIQGSNSQQFLNRPNVNQARAMPLNQADANDKMQGSNSQQFLNRPNVNQARAMPLNQADANDKMQGSNSQQFLNRSEVARPAGQQIPNCMSLPKQTLEVYPIDENRQLVRIVKYSIVEKGPQP